MFECACQHSTHVAFTVIHTHTHTYTYLYHTPATLLHLTSTYVIKRVSYFLSKPHKSCHCLHHPLPLPSWLPFTVKETDWSNTSTWLQTMVETVKTTVKWLQLTEWTHLLQWMPAHGTTVTQCSVYLVVTLHSGCHVEVHHDDVMMMSQIVACH